MRYLKTGFLLVAFAGSSVLYNSTPSYSLTETKITTVTTTGNPITLPSAGTYVVVDPLTGVIKGHYDPLRTTFDYPISSGLVVIDQDTGKVLATFDSSGRLLDVISTPATDALVASIDARRAELQQAITDGLSKGTITPSTASSLRAALDTIAAEELADQQSNHILTYAEALSLATALNGVSDRVIPLAHLSVTTPLIASHFTSLNGQVLMLDDVAYRKAQFERRIDDEYTAGRLSARQVARLKEDLNDIAYLETKYKKHGSMSESQTEKISARFDKMNTNLDRDIAEINEKRSNIGLRVE
jgi:hypothetical protein